MGAKINEGGATLNEGGCKNFGLKKRKQKIEVLEKMRWQCFEILSAIRSLMIFVLKMIWYCDINIHSDAMLLWYYDAQPFMIDYPI